jgi:DNA-directed RNA polymerase subunit H (RpoH/RPB5)
MIELICKEMLEQRQYTDIHQVSHDYIIFEAMKNKTKVGVFLYKTEVFDNDNLTKLIQITNDNEIGHVIIVYDTKITPHVKNTLSQIHTLKIELFEYKNLLFNPTKHSYVPPHRKLSEEDAKVFREKYGKQISKISTEDTISKFLNFEKNDIIEIGNEYSMVVEL